MQKIVTYDGIDYTLATIVAGTMKNISFSIDGTKLTPKEFNLNIVAASLVAGGHSDTQTFAENLPIFTGDYGEFLGAAFEVNGLKVEKAVKGEEKAGASPAVESTGLSSTEDSANPSDGDIAT